MFFQLQRATISQRQRPVEASLRNRLLVWRFLKKIENEPVPSIDSQPELFISNVDNYHSNLDDNNNDPWMLDLNPNYAEDNGIDMDIESNLVTMVEENTNSNDDNPHSICDSMNIDQGSDVTLLLKRAIGAERRQKSSSSDSFHFHDSNPSNSQPMSDSNTFEETEQFFHDLCAELTNTTATLVSSSATSNALNFSATPEQTLIH